MDTILPMPKKTHKSEIGLLEKYQFSSTAYKAYQSSSMMSEVSSILLLEALLPAVSGLETKIGYAGRQAHTTIILEPQNKHLRR